MPISDEAFARKMLKALARRGVTFPLQYDAEQFAIVSQENGRFFLGSAYQQ